MSLRVEAQNQNELVAFYRVSADTSPFRGNYILVGYYANQEIAILAGKFLKNYHEGSPKLPSGLNVSLDPLTVTRKGLHQFQLRQTFDCSEQERLTKLVFQETVASSKTPRSSPVRDSDSEEDPFPPKKIPRKHEPSRNYIPLSKNFIEGVSAAEEIAQEKYGHDFHKIQIAFSGSGICTMNSIELQDITLTVKARDAYDISRYRKIGKISPEQEKSATKIRDELLALIQEAFQQTPELFPSDDFGRLNTTSKDPLPL